MFIIAPDIVFQCFLHAFQLPAQPELRIPCIEPSQAPVWNPQFRRIDHHLPFYPRNQVVVFLARRLLMWPIGYSQSLFINRGAFLDSSLQAAETITVRGILVPVSWNASGEIVCVAVSTFDEKEYRIACDDLTDQWRDYLNQEIAIHGRPFLNGVELWIAVQTFHVVQSAQDPDLNAI